MPNKAPPSRSPVTIFLTIIERAGNALPDPAMLFLCGTILVMVLSWVGATFEWSVLPVKLVPETVAHVDATGQPVLDAATGQPVMTPIIDEATGRPKMALERGTPETAIRPTNLLSADGLYWCIVNMVKNFTSFAPLGIVLVGMLGIGVAEGVGLFGAVLKWLAGIVPATLLTPVVVFLGVMANIASDAGYVVLPPVAAALYATVGRSPLVGIAAAFAGIAGGFSANLLVAGSDVLCTSFTLDGARVLDKDFTLPATCNWWFLIASTFLLVAIGWGVTAWVVEPRCKVRSADDGGPQQAGTGGPSQVSADMRLTAQESKGLRAAGLWLGIMLTVVLAMIFINGAPLHGEAVDDRGHLGMRWIQSIVPIIFFVFLAPGLGYGISTGTIRAPRDAVLCMTKAMKDLAPVLVLAFFASQFIKIFDYSKLGNMLAMWGGATLADADLKPTFILTLFVLICLIINLLISSMSAKWSLLAPIFVPMFMVLGIHPALTQAAYRVGDSVTNCITPMNAYLVIILSVVNRYVKREGGAGLGTIISLMIPYSIAFAIGWTILLILWMNMGWSLGPGGPLHYAPMK